MTTGTVTTTARTSAKVINLSPTPAGLRVARAEPAEVVNLQPILHVDRAEARHKQKQRQKLWDRAWCEFQAYRKVEYLVSDLCSLKRGQATDGYLFKQFSFLLRQSGGAFYFQKQQCALRLFLTPAPSAAALAWKRANAKRHHWSAGEAKSVVAMVEADQAYFDLTASRRKGRRGRGKAAH